MAHARERRGGDRGRQRGREDEAAGVAANRVDDAGRAGDEAAERAVALGEAALHDRHLAGCAERLRDPGALAPVGAGGVRLVEVRERPVLGRERADLTQRCDVGVHRVDRLEGDDARPLGRQALEQLAQVLDVRVAEDQPLGPGGADAVDHRRVVALVRQDHAALEQAAERAQAGLVGDEAGGEDERRLLRVEVGELVLQLADDDVRARDVARPARTDAVLGERLGGGRDDRRMQAHAEVVVRAPVDDDAPRAVGQTHERRPGGRALEIDEMPVAALLAKGVEAVLERFQGGRERRMRGAHGARWRRRSHSGTVARGGCAAVRPRFDARAPLRHARPP